MIDLITNIMDLQGLIPPFEGVIGSKNGMKNFNSNDNSNGNNNLNKRGIRFKLTILVSFYPNCD